MSVAAGGGFNGGGDKKGKGMSTEFPPPLYEEDKMEEDEEPPNYGVENLHSIKQNISKDKIGRSIKDCEVCVMLGQPVHVPAKPPVLHLYRDPDDDDFKGRQYSKKPRI